MSGIEKRMLDKILSDNNINEKDVEFTCMQNGQDSEGHLDGTYTVVGKERIK